jgi:NADPH:quinone reductase-like Zn-dependent oxidoreductase
MRAIIQDSYGPPNTALVLGEIDTPTIRDDEVLVRSPRRRSPATTGT